MILAIEVENSSISIGCVDQEHIYFWERITSVIGKPSLEYAISLKSVLELYGVDPKSITGSIVSSVVPPLTRTLSAAVQKVTGIRPKVVGAGIKTGLNIRMDNPKSVGSDLIATSVAALQEYKPPIIIINTGTATTFAVIGRNSDYIGGAICPGIRVAMESLSSSTSQLPRISLDTPKKVIGKSTIDCMQSGVIYGNAAMLDGMLDRMEQELGEPASIVATGGIVKLLLPLMKHTVNYDGTLLLKGLREIYYRNC